MKTDLAQIFRQISELQDGNYEPHQTEILRGKGYDTFISVLKSSSASKLQYRASYPEELWTIPAIGLILADTLIIRGWYNDASVDKNLIKAAIQQLNDIIQKNVGAAEAMSVPSGELAQQVGHRPKNGKMIARIDMLTSSEVRNIEIPDLGPGVVGHPAFAYFAPEQTKKWLKDARPFIDEGRLIYLPQRIVMKFGSQARDTKFEDIEIDSPWGIWRPIINASKTRSALLLPDTSMKHYQNMTLYQVLDVAMPYLKGLSLRDLHRVMSDEEDTLIAFRNAVSNVLSTFLSKSHDVDNPSELVNIGLQMRRDVIDPELARLNQLFKKITQVRAIRIAGATLGTIGLIAAALSTGGLTAIASVALSAGSAGVMSKEIAEYRSEILSLQENPWYFAWELKKLGHSK